MATKPAKSSPHHHFYKHKSEVLNKVEHFIDRSIPYLLVLLALLLILDNPFWTLYSLEHFEPEVTYLDYTILAFFVVDLTFKWFHTRRLLKFVRLYWLDIIAVLPFYLGFRVYARFRSILLVGEEIAEAQRVAHEAVLIREARLLRESEILRETRPVARGLRSLGRFLRFLSGRQEVVEKGFKSAILHREG